MNLSILSTLILLTWNIHQGIKFLTHSCFPVTGTFESECECCQATSFRPVTIELNCRDGSIIPKEIQVPNKCSCTGCSAAGGVKGGGVKGGVKGVKTPSAKYTKTKRWA